MVQGGSRRGRGAARLTGGDAGGRRTPRRVWPWWRRLRRQASPAPCSSSARPSPTCVPRAGRACASCLPALSGTGGRARRRCVAGVSSVCRRCVVGVSPVCRRCVVGVSSVCRRCVAGVSPACRRCCLPSCLVCLARSRVCRRVACLAALRLASPGVSSTRVGEPSPPSPGP